MREFLERRKEKCFVNENEQQQQQKWWEAKSEKRPPPNGTIGHIRTRPTQFSENFGTLFRNPFKPPSTPPATPKTFGIQEHPESYKKLQRVRKSG
jgi:hypothetical protein